MDRLGVLEASYIEEIRLLGKVAFEAPELQPQSLALEEAIGDLWSSRFEEMSEARAALPGSGAHPSTKLRVAQDWSRLSDAADGLITAAGAAGEPTLAELANSARRSKAAFELAERSEASDAFELAERSEASDASESRSDDGTLA